jgi:hypothetical protein
MPQIKFTQLVVRTYDDEGGRRQSSIVALGSDGKVYQYYHREGAWVPLSSDILRRA